MCRNQWKIVILILACLSIYACSEKPASTTTNEIKPATIVDGSGSSPKRVILTAEAAKLIGLELVSVRDVQNQNRLQKIVPYSAVLYDLNGKAWIYISPEPLTFMRAAITIDSINGDQVILVNGPPAGTQVVAVGATELYGSEYLGNIQP